MRKTSFSFYLLGPGLYGSWGFLLFFWIQSVEAESIQGNIGYLGSIVITSCIIMALAKKLSRLSSVFRLALAGCIIMISSFAIEVCFMTFGTMPPAVDFLLRMLLGSGMSMFWMAWGHLLLFIEVEKMELAFLYWMPILALVFIAMGVGTFVFGDISSFYAVLLILVPLLSLMAFSQAYRLVTRCSQSQTLEELSPRGVAPPEHLVPDDEVVLSGAASSIKNKQRYDIFLNLVFASIALSIIWSSLLSSSVPAFSTSIFLFAIGSLVLFFIVWFALRTTRRFGFSTMYLWVLPLVVVGVVVHGFDIALMQLVSVLCLSVVNIGFDIMVKLLSVHMALRSPSSSWHIIAIGSIVPSFGGMIAPFVMLVIKQSAFASTAVYQQIMLVTMALFVIVVSVALGKYRFYSPSIVLIGKEETNVDEVLSREVGSLSKTRGEPTDALTTRCFNAAKKYGLSSREFDVLVLLIQGRSRTHIRETLYISKGTVDTHIHHIYVKMGINSKNELMKLILDDGASA